MKKVCFLAYKMVVFFNAKSSIFIKSKISYVIVE